MEIIFDHVLSLIKCFEEGAMFSKYRPKSELCSVADMVGDAREYTGPDGLRFRIKMDGKVKILEFEILDIPESIQY